MPRRNFNDGQEIVYEDLNGIAQASERSLYDRYLYQLLQQKTDGFMNDGCLVEYATPTSVTVRAGVGFQSDPTQVSPEPQKRPIYIPTQETKTLSSPHGSLDRIDIICIKAAIADEISSDRKHKDAISETISTQSLVVQKDWNAELQIVAGTAAITPSAPSVPAGYIKIAEMYVTAVTGMADADAVTDTRTKLPIAEDVLINTLGYNRVTAAAETNLKTIFDDIDSYLSNGLHGYTDMIELASGDDDPTNPAADRRRMFWKDGVFYSLDDSGSKVPIGSGGGGGGSAVWHPVDGSAPEELEEYGEKVYVFAEGSSQKLTLYVKVPKSKITGRPVKMYIGQYSPSATNTQLLSATTYLVRQNLDAVDAPPNSHASNNAAITNTVANQYREVEIDLTDASGQINSTDVDAGDLLKIQLTRGTDTDTDDIRFIPSATEITFA